MKTKRLISILILIGIIFGILCYSAFTDGYKTGYQKATENLIERLDKCEADYSTLKEDNDLMWQFRNERCVCRSWHSSNTEAPLTKDEICNYPLKMYGYREDIGYSDIEYWEAEPSY